MAELDVTTTDGRTRRHPLTGAVILGREPGCDILLDDLGTSRRHARIRREGDGYIVEDLGSKNGTVVNDSRCESAPLSDGDVVLLGAVRVRFVDEQARAEPSTSVVVADEGPSRHITRYSQQGKDLRLPENRLQTLYNLAGRLTRLRDRDELLNDVLDVCFDMLGFERGAIAVRRTDGRGVDWPAVRNLRGTGGELTVSRSVLSRALDHGERAVINDTGATDFDPTISIVQLGIRSAMCVPLRHHDEILGVIYGDRLSTGVQYTDQDVDFLDGLAQLVSIGLINARLVEEQQAKLRLEHEISLARGIQQRLFPAVLPDRDDLQVAVLNDPGRHVSGDYYDVIELQDGRVALLIADVTGEGVAASLLMANLQAAVRVTLPGSDNLGELMGQWNRLVYENTEASKFVTGLAAIVDPAARRLTMANAGHHQPFILQPDAGRCYELEADAGFPLGVVQDGTYATQAFDLGPGPCTLFCYTDGVIEAMNEEHDLFTLQRMTDLLRANNTATPVDLIKRMRKAIHGFCSGAVQSDDITMLAASLA